MKVLYLTSGTHLGSTGRILQHWLQMGADSDLLGSLVVRPGSEYAAWGAREGVPTLVDAMPWPEKRAPWRVVWHAARVARWARRQGVQVIHCNEHDVYPFANVLRKFLRLPIVCHVRFRLHREFAEWAFGGNRSPDALMWTSQQQRVDSADAVAGIVPEERQHLLRLGVDVEDMDRYREQGAKLRRKLEVADHEVLVGMPSPLRPRKRVEDFVELIRRLANEHPQVVGILAGQEVPGDEEYRSRIERLIAESQLGRRLRWIGHLNPVEPFHHACDLSVSTSEYETFGNSVCEAMACGKPVVAYRGGSVAEVIGDAGSVVDDGDLAELVLAVQRLVEDAGMRLSIGEKARQRVLREFNPTQSFQQIRFLYSSFTNPAFSAT